MKNIYNLMKKILTSRILLGIIFTAVISIWLFHYSNIEETNSFFIALAFVVFYFRIDSRLPILGALFFLILIMLFSTIDSLHITEYYIQGDLEKMAVWVYFFLVIGVAKQIWEYRSETKNKNNSKKDLSFDTVLGNFDKNALKITMWLAIGVSIGSFLFFYLNGQWNLIYSDTYAHLNMARKVFDNISPGFTQLGDQWLPLLHLLMLPFVWNNFLWQTGIAGALVSMPAFVLSVYFIFKLIDLLFKDKKSAFIGALVYMTSINMLYLQTTAMMESLFNLTIIASVYFISRWAVKKNIFDLIIGGLFIMLSTLTRYEGYGVFAMALLAVLVIAYFKKKKSKSKGMLSGILILFGVISGVGIFLWISYSAFIFNSPFNWLHPLQSLSAISLLPEQSTTPALSGFAKSVAENSNNPSTLTKSLVSSAFYTNGALVSMVALIGLVMLIFKIIKKPKNIPYFAGIIFVLIAPYIFLIITTALGKISIYGPSILSLGVFNKWSNYAAEGGMRYTLSLLPFVAVFVAVASLGSIKKKAVILMLIVLQSVFVFIGPVFLSYNFAIKWKQVYGQNNASVDYMKNNYDGGLILVSTLTHEEDMFKYDIPYKNYIHEGAKWYWKESLKNPEKYARWIILNGNTSIKAMGGSDILTRVFQSHPERLKDFEIVYDDDNIKIYKIKNK